MAFPITCPSCGKGFQLATEIYERKVAGKVVSIKCKQCQAGIRVDATTPGELKVTGANAASAGTDSVITKQPDARARQPTLLGLVGPGGHGKAASAERGAAPLPPAPPPPPEALWAVDSGEAGEDRELTDEQMKREIESGVLVATTLVWREGQDDWLEIASVPQLARYLPQAKPAAPRPRLPSAPGVEPPRAPPPAVPRVGGSDEEDEEDATMIYARGAADAPKLKLPELSPEYEPAAAAPPPAAWNVAPGILPAAGRPAAPAPKAPLPPAPPPPAAMPAPPPLTSSAPTPPPFAAPSAPTPAPFPAPPAPAARPAPAPPSPANVPAASPMGVMPPSPFAVAATTTDLDFPKPKSKLPLVIGALVAVGVVVGVVVVMSSGSKPAPVPTPAATPPTPTTTPTTAPPPTQEAPTPPADTATPAPTPPSGNGGNLLAPPQSPSSKSGSGFSDLFAQGMEKAEKSGSSPSPAQPFDQEEAKRAVAAMLKTVAACKEPGSPLGQTTAAVTFESSGKVSSVTIGAPFAGTSTGTCMVTAFKQVKVTPFAGLPGTVSQAVSLR